MPVARGYRVDSVHDALVVRCRAVGIDRGQFGRHGDAVAHVLATLPLAVQQFRRNHDFRPGEGAVAEVRENAHENLPAAHALDQRRNPLAHAVDQVRAHRVAGIDQQVQDQHFAFAAGHGAPVHFDIDHAAASRHHARVNAVGQADDLLAPRQQVGRRVRRVGHVEYLDLTDQHRVVGFRRKAACLAYELGGGTQGGDDRGLFHRHGGDIVAPVDQEIESEAHRQSEDADHVLDHPIGARGVQARAAPGQVLEVRLAQKAMLKRGLHPLARRKTVETGYSGTLQSAGNYTKASLGAVVAKFAAKTDVPWEDSKWKHAARRSGAR